MKNRVVITGIGAVIPIGNNVKIFWDNIKQELKYVMSNSLGFGGHNATIILKKWDGR